ncbi:MAG: diguanylate cyclase [Candidatus Tenebribacter burtonii]|jgi:diguanylate cyclase (GGDEF)-like protein|nr:diguanylate cyclase [Candidatus Tenebribacter burtonii]
MQKQINILIVEDNIIFANDIKQALEKFNYNIVDIAKTSKSALKIVKKSKPDLVLADIMLEGSLDGINITNKIQQEYNIPVIYVASYSNKKTINKIKLTAPYGYITKPIRDYALFSSIEIALYKFQIDKTMKETKDKIEKLHIPVIELTTCKSNKSILKVTEGALRNIFGIYNFAFYKKQKDQIVLLTKITLKIFKAKYHISEGIVGKAFSLDKLFIYNRHIEFKDIEPEWKNIGSVISYKLNSEMIFLAVSSNEMAFDKEFTSILSILFKHTKEAFKRIGYEKRLEKKAMIDPLTNVYNRLYYNQTIEQQTELAKRYNNNIGFIVIDIDNLKKINDKFGHSMGDEAIKFAASIILSQARESDYIIRSGGDEFLIVLQQTGEEVDFIKNRLRKAMVDFNKESKLPFPVYFSIGSAFWNFDMNKTIDNIIDEADSNMYIEKHDSTDI